MSGNGSTTHARRWLRAGGPPAGITAALGIGATGIAGEGIENSTAPLATRVAQTVGLDPNMGPILLLGIAILVLIVAYFVPGLFEDRHQ